jgi:salicylate hydroxylase
MMIREPMEAWSKGRVTCSAMRAIRLPFLGGRRDVDRGRLCRRGLSRQIFQRAGRGLRPLRGSAGADLDGRPQGQREQSGAFAQALADEDRIADEVAREWQQVRLRERMDWLYNYDATAIAI